MIQNTLKIGQKFSTVPRARKRTSERASERAQWSARAKRAVRSKRGSERCERTSERSSEWPYSNIPISRLMNHCALTFPRFLVGFPGIVGLHVGGGSFRSLFIRLRFNVHLLRRRLCLFNGNERQPPRSVFHLKFHWAPLLSF